MSFHDVDYGERAHRVALAERKFGILSHYGHDHLIAMHELTRHSDDTLRTIHENFLRRVQKSDVGYISPRLQGIMSDDFLDQVLAAVRTSRMSNHLTQRYGQVETPEGPVYWAILKAGSLVDLWKILTKQRDPFQLELWHSDDIGQTKRPGTKAILADQLTAAAS